MYNYTVVMEHIICCICYMIYYDTAALIIANASECTVAVAHVSAVPTSAAAGAHLVSDVSWKFCTIAGARKTPNSKVQRENDIFGNASYMLCYKLLVYI